MSQIPFINSNLNTEVLGGCPTIHDRLQTQLFGPYFSSFSAHSYCYELSNKPKPEEIDSNRCPPLNDQFLHCLNKYSPPIKSLKMS